VFWLQGKLAGVSGICGGIMRWQKGDVGWRVAFVVGLALVGLIGARFVPEAFSTAGEPALALVALSGALVGFGTQLCTGCTSGHGVCGISRLSQRTIAATMIFMLVAGVTSFVLRHVLGGGA
jgi:uncharacterized membrane protein YedE/YeeE